MIDRIAIVKNIPSCLESQLEVWWRSAWHALRSHCRTNPWCPNTLGTVNPNHRFSTKIAVELHFSGKRIVGRRIYLHFVRMTACLGFPGGRWRWWRRYAVAIWSTTAVENFCGDGSGRMWRHQWTRIVGKGWIWGLGWGAEMPLCRRRAATTLVWLVRVSRVWGHLRTIEISR